METAELERRRRVWDALSDAFLDTETRWYFPKIAGVLVQSGYTESELNRIWRHEIVPGCLGNLLQVAGEWGAMALDEPALVKRASKAPGIFARVLCAPAVALMSRQWQQILALRSVLMARAEKERTIHVGIWTAFAKAYLEDQLENVFSLQELYPTLSATGSRSFCEATFSEDFRPIYSKLLIGRERSVEKARAANVLEIIARAFP